MRKKINSEQLPVYREKERILRYIEKNQVVVVESPTGSGKTTQLPLILHNAGYSKAGVIGVTQPRRIAALSVCEYIADQTGTETGTLAGYKMRFEDVTSPETRIKIMTDGILLQELKADPYLSRYSVIMVDEAHERSLNIDFILGLLKKVLDERKDLKIIISSATINAEVFSEYFNKCPVIHIDTEIFPIDIFYEPPSVESSDEEMIRKITEIVTRTVRKNYGGDILIFLPGEKVIKDCIKSLSTSDVRKNLFILPLYARLSREEQEQVFIDTPEGKTKVVVSTNIAETSVTIDGIATVIDSGRAKINFYSPTTYTSSLVEKPIATASCNQRKGRAGRTGPGRCYRLYSKQDFTDRPMFTLEEIYRTDLSEVVLRMAELGISEFSEFDFISPPGKDGIVSAVETLRLLGALNDENGLSTIGEMMAAFPMLPRHSRMIVEAINRYPDVLEETITAAAFLSAHSPYLLPQGEEMAARSAHHSFSDTGGDFVSYLKLLDAFLEADDKEKFCTRFYLDEKTMTEINNIKFQIEEIVREIGVPISAGGSTEDYLCAVSGGLMQFVCCRTGRGVYRSLTAEQILIHPGSVMFRENPRFIVAGEVVRTSRMFARSVSPLKKEWLKRISEDLFYELVIYNEGQQSDGRQQDGQRGARREKGQKQEGRNGTGVTIGGVSFDVKPWKSNKKIVELPWSKLRPVIERLSENDLSRIKKYRGNVLVGGGEFLTGMRMRTIIKICSVVDPERDSTMEMPAAFFADESVDWAPVIAGMNKIMKLYRKERRKKTFGFITLHTDGNRSYWYQAGRSFTSSIQESISSLEVLADQTSDNDVLKKVSSVYRRLNELLEL